MNYRHTLILKQNKKINLKNKNEIKKHQVINTCVKIEIRIEIQLNGFSSSGSARRFKSQNNSPAEDTYKAM